MDLLNPRCTVLVAEQPVSQQPQSSPENVRSSQMLAWMEQQGFRQESGANRIVGFAIWKIRGVGREDGSDVMSWVNWSRKKQADLELAFWKRIYTRKDQDRLKYEAYLLAEEECEKKYYKEPCYFLDNLAVDFRCQRQGIGAALVRRGLETAKTLQLHAQTEAGAMGEGLYAKLGFKVVGSWDISLPDAATISLPVMKRPVDPPTA